MLLVYVLFIKPYRSSIVTARAVSLVPAQRDSGALLVIMGIGQRAEECEFAESKWVCAWYADWTVLRISGLQRAA